MGHASWGGSELAAIVPPPSATRLPRRRLINVVTGFFIGCLLLYGVGRTVFQGTAIEEFKAIYSEDIGFRDVAKKVEELKG